MQSVLKTINILFFLSTETFDSPDTIRASFGPTVCMLPMLLLIVDDDDDVEDEVSYKLK